MLEGKRLRTKGAVLRWQKQGPCSALCGTQCARSPNRIFCSWRIPHTVHEHHNRMDELLCSYKGVVVHENVKQPIFRVRRQVATRNRFKSERMVWNAARSRYLFADREPIHPAFGLRPDYDDTLFDDVERGYDSESDPEATSSDEDSDG